MQPSQIDEAAALISQHWKDGTRMPLIPARCRPESRADGFAVQAAAARLLCQSTLGWKIAASSVAGQRHIAVDGPLAGRLLAQQVLTAGANEANRIGLQNNILRVAEPEFVFRMARPLPRRDVMRNPYSQDEVMPAVDGLHLAIEIPDTRLSDYVNAGAASLIADFACAAWWVVGPVVTATWREIDLSRHAVTANKNGREVATGSGANVLGDPRIALTWIGNELATHESGLKAGDYVTTGTSVVPVPIEPGDMVMMDFGVLGCISAGFTPN